MVEWSCQCELSTGAWHWPVSSRALHCRRVQLINLKGAELYLGLLTLREASWCCCYCSLTTISQSARNSYSRLTQNKNSVLPYTSFLISLFQTFLTSRAENVIFTWKFTQNKSSSNSMKIVWTETFYLTVKQQIENCMKGSKLWPNHNFLVTYSYQHEVT